MGIDLGTTNSAVAVSCRFKYYRLTCLSGKHRTRCIKIRFTNSSCLQRFAGRRPVIIKQEGGASTLPSVVGYLPDGQILIGQEAQRSEYPQAVVSCLNIRSLPATLCHSHPRHVLTVGTVVKACGSRCTQYLLLCQAFHWAPS